MSIQDPGHEGKDGHVQTDTSSLEKGDIGAPSPEAIHVIAWRDQDDPENPMNWTLRKKVTMVALVSALGFLTPFASSVSAPPTDQILKEFGSTSTVLGSFTTSIYVLGSAAGPLVCAPSSEIWGRWPVIQIANILFCAFTMACALAPDFASLFVFRFIAGAAGSAALTVGGGVIGDTIPVQSRGKYVAVFAMGGTIGPSIGPVIGGFLGEYKGWRWTYWLTLIIAVALTIISFLFLRESFAPAILKAKARKYQRDNPDMQVTVEGVQAESTPAVFKRAFTRPYKILFMSPIALLLAIYQSLLWGYIYLLFTTYPLIFGTVYGWDTGLQGLSYLALGIGNVIAMLCSAKLSDRLNQVYANRRGGTPVPEGRLILMMVSAPLVAVGFFWYGWTAKAGIPWIVPLLGNVVLGFGILATMVPTNLYMIDFLTRYAASALSGSFFLRSLFGGLLPLAGTPMFDSLGVGWGASLLGFISLAMSALPYFFMRYGQTLREKFPVNL